MEHLRRALRKTLSWLGETPSREDFARLYADLQAEHKLAEALLAERERHNLTLRHEADALRDLFDRFKWLELNEARHAALRKKLHDLRGA